MICLRIERASWATDQSTRPYIARGWWGSHPPRGDKNEVVRKALFAITAATRSQAYLLAVAAAKVMHDQGDEPDPAATIECIVGRDGTSTFDQGCDCRVPCYVGCRNRVVV